MFFLIRDSIVALMMLQHYYLAVETVNWDDNWIEMEFITRSKYWNLNFLDLCFASIADDLIVRIAALENA